TAVLSRHSAFHAFHNGGNRAAVIFEWLCAIADLDVCPAANVLVVRALIGILKPAPTTDVINQNCTEIRTTVVDIADELLQRIAPLNSQTTLARALVATCDDHPSALCILANRVTLIFGRVLLVLGRHPDVFRGSYRGRHQSSRGR